LRYHNLPDCVVYWTALMLTVGLINTDYEDRIWKPDHYYHYHVVKEVESMWNLWPR